jgi:hypothetical protein
MTHNPLTNPTSLACLIKAADDYRIALIADNATDDMLHKLYASAFDVFGTDELYEAMQETDPVNASEWVPL